MRHHLTWHGHAAFQIDSGDETFLIDPYFDGNPSAVKKAAEMTKADFVLVTHDHFDHIGQALDICQATGATLAAIVDTTKKLIGMGLPAAQTVNGMGFNIGGTVPLGKAKVTMTQAIHSSDSGVPVGYVLTLADGFVIYHAGDTGLFAGMELLGKLFSIDLALLPVGGVFTMDARQAAVACTLLRCKKVVPMHWGSFGILAQNTEALAVELENLGADTEVMVMVPGEKAALYGEGAGSEDCDCA